MHKLFCRTTLLLGAVLALSGCNTIEGMGQDIQKAGQAIEGAGRN